MEEIRQQTEDRLDPALGARVSYHQIRWSSTQNHELIQTGGNLNFHILSKNGTQEHTRDFAEIMLVSAGKMIYQVNGERRLTEAGDLHFIRPDDLHAFEPAPDLETCELLLLDFNLELFLTLSQYLENDGFLQKFTEPVLPPKFKLDLNAANDLVNRMLKINSGSTSPELRKVRLKILLAELFARYFIDENTLLSESQVPSWIEALCKEMRKVENFSIGLARMQKLACKTPEHLCKSFQRYLHKTPTEFINELKINHAASLLADSDTDIILIADQLNFKSLSRFYHLFKSRYGLSPATYRRRYASNKNLKFFR